MAKILIVIVLIALFFRTYEIIGRFEFAHDGDLYSWIVKDIALDHHPRLIGQLTTAPGIYIGPFFYYLLIPFFLLTKMDPVGAIIPITAISLIAVFSYYWVFKKLFNPGVGLIGAFLYSVLLWIVQLDRRVVPSTPTNLWVIWYFFTLINLARGNFKVLWILGVLIALIWHIHIALTPVLLAVPVAILVSRKFPSRNQLTAFLLMLFIFSLPLIVFEVKHEFSQIRALLDNLSLDQGGEVGFDKLHLLTYKAALNAINLIFSPQLPLFLKDAPLIAAILLSAFLLVKRKLLKFSDLVSLYAWIAGVFIFYTLSSTVISEYYLSNYEVIFIAIFSFWFYILFKSSSWGKILTLAIFSFILIKNFYYIVTLDYYHKAYVERKGAASFVRKDSVEKGFPCVAVSYITTPGENVGFRYFFYLNNLHVNQPKSGSPVYTIVIPDELAEGKNQKYFGHIKVIPPEDIPSKEKIDQSCSGQNANLTDPLLGYTE